MANTQTSAHLDKLRDEMAANTNNSMLCTVGEVLTVYAGEHPETIQALVAEGKSLMGAIDAMRKAADKKRSGASCVALDMGEGMKIVLEYFGIAWDARGITRAAFSLMSQEYAPAVQATKGTAGLDLDSLLGV